METIHLITALPDQWVVAQKGKYLDERHYDCIVRKPTDVYTPDGGPLLLFRPGALRRSVCDAARPALRRAASGYNDHRHLYTSAIGYYDKPTCRETRFTGKDLDGWPLVLPFISECDGVFQRELPTRYNAQRQLAERTNPRWVIGATAFTTVTVNRWTERHNSRTRVHVDAGDLRDGFGVISVVSSGAYRGGYLIFPKHQVAVDVRTTDVLLCDVHEFHANAPIIGKPGWERLSTILYYRTAMQNCPKR